MQKKVILLVPLTFNDGTSIPREILEAIYEEVYVEFGGYTLAGVVKGAYRMRSGGKQVDDSQEVWIVLDEDRLPDLKSIVARFCGRLGQEAMYFEVTEAGVEFIKPNGAGGKP